MLKGIDVSKHNGTIDWVKVNKSVDFVMLRAGYGQTVDSKFLYNIQRCNELGIPVGVYWFSYACTVTQARQEAIKCISTIRNYKIDYPVCYDFEYDSINNAKKKGIAVTRNLMVEMARAFLTEVEKAGYYAMNYTNIDFLNKGFSELTSRFDIWLAQWGKSSPSRPCGIWQYSSTGKINGIKGNVDLNYALKSFSRTTQTSKSLTDENKKSILTLPESWWATYLGVAYSVIEGMYGDGDERKSRIKAAGFDYTIVQRIVNILMEK